MRAGLSADEKRRLLTTLLKSVSRVFYLSMRVLPSGMREPISVAYLLARTADTITDTTPLPHAQKLAHLRHLRRMLTAAAASTDGFADELAPMQPDPAQERLLRALPQTLTLLRTMSPADADLVHKVVLTLMDGMEFDLTAFENAGAGDVIALRTPSDLDAYTYKVAGCVGEFWTALTMAHTPSTQHWDRECMTALGVRFGQALQLTNILRDVPQDLQAGRSYFPLSELRRVGLDPHELMDAANSERARPVLAWGVRAALERFSDAERYILAIPRRNLRLRLAALWSVLIGCYTLLLLARNRSWLDSGVRVKVPRIGVYGIIAASLLCGRSNSLVRLWLRYVRRSVLDAL